MRKRIVIGAVVAVLVVAWLVFGRGPEAELVQIQFTGFTNHQGGTQLLALYAITNVSNVRLHVSGLLEVKTGGEWPVYGPEMRPNMIMMDNLPAHQSTTVNVAVPDLERLARSLHLRQSTLKVGQVALLFFIDKSCMERPA